MANFGWAYVNCTDESGGGGQAAGPTGSVQFLTGANSTNGSAALMYHTASDTSVHPYSPSTLVLSGNLLVTGSISASIFHYEDITRIDATGSTFFGNTNDDTHMRTGSLIVSNQSNVTIFSASATTQATRVRGFNVLYEFVPSTTGLVAVYTASTPSYIIGVRSTGSVQIQIPSASTYESGALLLVKDEVGHLNGTDITLSASGPAVTYTIDGASSYTLTGSNPAISLYSNGANWFVF
jgi:hypothetical protein